MNLFETVLALTISVFFFALIAHGVQQKTVLNRDRAIAHDLIGMRQAALAYAENNLDTLFAAAKEDEGPSFSTQNGVPDEFAPYLGYAHAGKNMLGQYYEVLFRSIPLTQTRKALLLLVRSRGEKALSLVEQKRIASFIAVEKVATRHSLYSFAGALHEDALETPSGNFSLARIGIRGEQGTFAMVQLIFSADAAAIAMDSSLLFRRAVPDYPSLNTLETDLSLGGNRILAISGLTLLPRKSLCNAPNEGLLELREESGEKTLMLCREKDGVYAWEQLGLAKSNNP